MYTKTFLLGAVCAALLLFPSHAAFAATKGESSSESKANISFMKKAANANMTEIQLGKIAQENGQKADVKSFGERMVKDHGNASDQLKTVAEKLNVRLPKKVNAKHQALVDKLSKLKGANFDKAYANAMVEDHRKVIKQFEKAQGEVTQPDLKKFIDDTIPVLKTHLELAKKL